MADCVSNAPSHNQLTYTVTNERGWNDPPASVFCPSGTTSRKRIDPRKARVHHNINASFYNQPIKGGNTAFQSNMSRMEQSMEDMLVSPKQTLSHANSNPDLSSISPITNPPPPIMHHAMSVPNDLFNAGQSNGHPGYLNNMMAPPKSTLNIAPSLITRNVSHTPQTTTSAQKLGTANASSGIKDIFQNHSIPTMLQTSHLNKSFDTSQNMEFTSKNSITTTNRLCSNQNSHLAPHNPISPYTQCSSPVPMEPPQMSSVDTINQNAGFLISASTPEMLARVPSATMIVAPPPKDGFYTSMKGSPKSRSPGSSGHNSPVPNEYIENDSQLLNDTVKRLHECKDKCLSHLTNKVSDDISKRIAAFQISWNSGKLSVSVKLKMSELSQALEKSDFAQAYIIHKLLITAYSTEVISWMIGIKKLIESFQRAVQENNKFQ